MRVEGDRGVKKEAVPIENSLARNAIGRTGIRAVKRVRGGIRG